MQVHFQTRFGSLPRPYPLHSLLNPLSICSSYLHRTLTSSTAMVTESGSSKRPMCPKCSKPAQICLCTRLKTPRLENSIAVTILLHSLEKKHPLNSTRIASLGLRNLTVVSVSDVNFQARFVVNFLYLDPKRGSGHLNEKSSDFGITGNGKRKWDSIEGPISCSGLEESSDFSKFLDSQEEKRTIFVDSDEEFSKSTDFRSVKDNEFCKGETKVFVRESLDRNFREDVSKCCTSTEAVSDSKTGAFITKNIAGKFHGPVSGCSEDAVVAFTIEKHGAISSFCNRWISPDQLMEQNNFDQLLASRMAVNDFGGGFSVSKFQRKQLDGTVEYDEFEEFGVKVPPGSVLLFPSEKSVGIEDIDFEVKNLIVLDGTWAKAKRMYNENPWLKLLPHLKLDLDKLSLYSEVRHQPKAGCLSTIESIVFALKALGEDSEKLDGLLEVFKSMVGDQRRLKDERLSKVSVQPSNS